MNTKIRKVPFFLPRYRIDIDDGSEKSYCYRWLRGRAMREVRFLLSNLADITRILEFRRGVQDRAEAN